MSQPGTGMPSFVKALLVVSAVITILGAIVIFAGWMWWKKNQANITHSTSKARLEGAKIGEQSTEQACFDIAVDRVNDKAKFTQMIANGIFLGSCLEKSKISNGFCKDVPDEKEFTKSIQWRMRRCKNLKLENNTCSALLSVVQRYCHETRATLGKRG